MIFDDDFTYGLKIGNWPVGRALTRSSLEWEVRGSNLGPVKLDAVLPTACQRCNISSKEAVLPQLNNAEMGPRQLVTRFDVIQRV